MFPFPKFMHIDIYGRGNQTDLDDTLKYHGRLRDQYCCYQSKIPDNPIDYIIGNIIATYFNATLITFEHAEVKNSSKFSFPSMYPTIYPFQVTFKAERIWKRYSSLNNSPELPAIFKRHQDDNNFAYCSIQRSKFGSTWDFTIFTDPFDIWTWLILLFLLVVVSKLVSISSHYDFFTTFMSALAALLDNEMTRVVNSKLYVLWLFTTFLIFDFYSGAITSQVIAPPENVWMTKISQLEQHNYTIIFPNQLYANSFRESVKILNRNKHVNENLKVVTRLAEKLKIVNFRGGFFFRALVEQDQVAALQWWPYAMFAATQSNDILQKRNERHKKCIVGKEMFNTGEKFYVVTPPGSARVASMFQILQASGIFHRWNDEYHKMLQSTRVQDRARIKSRTELVKDETTIDILKVEGKVVTIFLLWAFCLGICLLSFVREIIFVRSNCKIFRKIKNASSLVKME